MQEGRNQPIDLSTTPEFAIEESRRLDTTNPTDQTIGQTNDQIERAHALAKKALEGRIVELVYRDTPEGYFLVNTINTKIGKPTVLEVVVSNGLMDKLTYVTIPLSTLVELGELAKVFAEKIERGI